MGANESSPAAPNSSQTAVWIPRLNPFGAPKWRIPYSCPAGWTPRPAPFNASKHGRHVEFSKQRSVAERVRPEDYANFGDAVVYTVEPVPVGEVWRVIVLDTVDKWSGGLAFGLTSELPYNAPTDLSGRDLGPHEWIYKDHSIWHNKHSRYCQDLPDLDELTPGQSGGLLVTPNGELYLYLFLYGERRCVIATGLPVDTPLYGVVAIHGRCSKIQSEMMTAKATRGDPLKLVEQLPGPPQSKSAELQQRRREVQLKKAETQKVAQERDASMQEEEEFASSKGDHMIDMGPPLIHPVKHPARAPRGDPLMGLKLVEQLLGSPQSKSAEHQQRRGEVQLKKAETQKVAQERDASIQEEEEFVWYGPSQSKSAELQQRRGEVQLKETQEVAEERDASIQQKDELGEKKAPGSPSEPMKPPTADKPLKSTIAMSELVISKDRLGGGAQGMVFRGTWKDTPVAVKKSLQPDPNDVHILLSLGGHPNVIRLYGVIVEDISCLIVTELAKGGSLYDFLYKKKKVPSDKQRSYWMKDIATGMEFLHHQGIAHRDLKSGNVLLGDRMTAKLCDFGTARSLNHTTAQSTVTGTYRWMAPEIVSDPDARINKKCDVYSYGMVLYELVTLKLPFHDAPTDQKAMVDAVMGKRPSLPEPSPEFPSFLRRLIIACWDADPKSRPSFQEINVALDTKKYLLI